MKQWSTREQLNDLLCELIRIPTVSGSRAEREFPAELTKKLSELPYFSEYPGLLKVHPTGDGRSLVTALAKSARPTARTVVLLSHFDVVETDCYGQWQPYAFEAKELTRRLYENPELLPEEARGDIATGEWLFGRGTMDMKCGLALHLSMLERACAGEFDGNVLLLAVPDEEVGSAGMRAAVPVLVDMAAEHGLTYAIVLNAESMHREEKDDRLRYLEKGSIGKALPGFLCVGKETHVAQPFEGLNGNYMAAELTVELELDAAFCERAGGQLMPPPTNLIQHGLMSAYSVTIPYRAVTMFNLLLLGKTVDQLMESLLAAAGRAARRIEARFAEKARRFAAMGGGEEDRLRVNIYSYEELLAFAEGEYGQDAVRRAVESAVGQLPAVADDRQAAAAAADALALLCKDKAPMIVLFFAPPYYPPIGSGGDPLVESLASELTRYAGERYGFELRHNGYHGAMLDLSYVGAPGASGSVRKLADNMPLWGTRYAIPFEAMERFEVPVMNFGPFGKDAHKWTERLNAEHAFGVMPDMLFKAISFALAADSR